MQKVVDFLEKHVQWVVLGLGALFVLYMIYAYVLTPPATTTIGGKEVTPATVDQAIVDNVADTLDAKVKSQAKIEIPVEPFDERFIATINNTNVAVAKLDGLVPPTLADAGRTPGETPGIDPNAPQAPVQGGVKLAELPKAKPLNAGKPAAPAPVVTGRSMLQKVQVAAVDDAAAAAAAAGNPGNPFINPDNPAAGANGQVQPVAVIDRDWASAFFTISMKDLAQAWRNAGIVAPAVPNIAQQTVFLQVVGEREEQTGVDAAGKPVWGNRTTLKPLPTVNILEVPDDNVPAQGQLVFQEWAVTAQGDILQPPFYPVAGGDVWHEPGVQVAPVGGNADGMFADPNAAPMDMMPPDPNRKQTPQEIRAAREAERKQKAEEAKARREAAKAAKAAENANKPPRGTGGPGMPSYQAFDPNRQPYRPPGAPPQFDPRNPAFRGAMPPGMQPGMQPGGAMGANANAVPQGLFVPNAQQPDVVTWVHDDTVQPGKTYRYRIRYVMKNPVYNTNLAGPNVTGIFALRQTDAQASDWTEPVTIATRTQFFLAGVQPPNKATVRVFRWEQGGLNVSEFVVQPGEPIGGPVPDPNGLPIDYTTGSTLVDIRENGVVLVLDDQNVLRQRSFDADRADPEQKKLQQQIAPPAAGANAAGQPIGMAR